MALAITFICFAVSLWLPKLSTRVPSALVAILVGILLEWAIVRPAFHTQTPIVGDMAPTCDFPKLFWFNAIYEDSLKEVSFNLSLLLRVLPLSVTMAAVGLLEPLEKSFEKSFSTKAVCM